MTAPSKSYIRALLLGILATSNLAAGEIDYTGLEALFGEPVTASATGKPQRVSDAPVTMAIITADEIQRSGAIDIPQILRRLAGVDVTRNFRGQADVGIRGYNQPLSNRLLVLVNGRQVYMDNLGMVQWHSFPVQLAEIKQIEVVRGPNTSLFGFNAASGVINIITYNPLHDDVDILETRVGDRDFGEVTGIATIGDGERFGIRVSGGGTHMDGFPRDDFSRPVADEDALEREAVNLDAQLEISDIDGLRLEVGYSRQAADMLVTTHNSANIEVYNRSFRLGYTRDSDVLGVVTAQFYRNESDFDLIFSRFGGPLQDTDTIRNRLHVFQLSMLRTFGPRHTIRFGAEARRTNLRNRVVGTGSGRFTMDIVAVNALWDWQLADRWTMTNAVRVDNWKTDRDGGTNLADSKLNLSLADYDRTDSEYSYNSSLVYRAGTDTTYRITAARGLHIPSLAELSRAIVNPVLENYGNPHLDAESNTTYELGLDHRLVEPGVDVGAVVFYQEIDDLIVQTITTTGAGNAKTDVTFENVGRSNAYGLEVSASGVLHDRLRWQTTYTLMQIEDKIDTGNAGFVHFDSNQPKHRVNLGLGYRVGRWVIDADWHYVRAVTYKATVIDLANSSRTAELDDYVIMNVNLAYDISDNTRISLSGYNLLQEHRERPRFHIVGAAGGGNELDRSVFATLRHRF